VDIIELRSSYPLAVKDKTQNQVVENLLEKQLLRTNHNKVASLPSAIDQEEGRPSRRKMDSDECLGSSANSLDEIEEATRRVSFLNEKHFPHLSESLKKSVENVIKCDSALSRISEKKCGKCDKVRFRTTAPSRISD